MTGVATAPVLLPATNTMRGARRFAYTSTSNYSAYPTYQSVPAGVTAYWNMAIYSKPVKMYTAIRWEVSPVLAAVSTLLTLTSLLFCLGIMMLQKKSMPDSIPVAGT